MQSEMPFYESPEDALKACVEAIGGAKKVGGMMFPDKTVDNARDYLLACLNEGRAEKLSVSQILYIFRAAKQAGFHAGWDYWSREAEYECRPITKAEEVDRLTTVVEQSTKTLAAALQQLERIQSGSKPQLKTVG
jgi:hypothetical protein